VYIIDFCFLFLVFCAFHLVAPPPSFPTQKQIVRVVSQIIYFTLALFYFRAFICLHCYRLVLLFLFNFFIPYFCCLYFFMLLVFVLFAVAVAVVVAHYAHNKRFVS